MKKCKKKRRRQSFRTATPTHQQFTKMTLGTKPVLSEDKHKAIIRVLLTHHHSTGDGGPIYTHRTSPERTAKPCRKI
jgi:hypothetical protein